jgi:hypothetical protein
MTHPAPTETQRHDVERRQARIRELEDQIDAILKPHADAFMGQIRALPKPSTTDRVQREAPPADLVPTMRAMLAAIARWPPGFYRTELRGALYGNCDLWGLSVRDIGGGFTPITPS